MSAQAKDWKAVLSEAIAGANNYIKSRTEREYVRAGVAPPSSVLSAQGPIVAANLTSQSAVAPVAPVAPEGGRTALVVGGLVVGAVVLYAVASDSKKKR